MGNETESKVPQIRFKGFEGEWVEKEFQSIAVRNNQISSEEYLPRIEYEDIISGEGQLNKDLFKKMSKKAGIQFHEGDVLFGKLRPYLKNWWLAEYSGIAVGDFWVLKSIYKASSFLYFLVQNKAFERIANQSAGSKMPRSDWKLVSTSTFFIPTTRDEQTKIGAYFREVDRLIGLHQRKHDKLETLKKAMLQKMFPQPGASTPEIRFKGFEGEWVERRLGEICEIVGGGTPSTQVREYWGGDIDWYSPTEIGKEVYAKGSVKKITQLGFMKCSAQLLPAFRTILFTSRAGIGDMAILTKQGCTNQGFQSFVLNENIDIYFVYSMGHLIKDHALRHASGSTFLEISSKQLEKMRLFLPNENEQQKIGAYFRTLDELISHHAVQLQKLKQLKSACLERMFV